MLEYIMAHSRAEMHVPKANGVKLHCMSLPQVSIIINNYNYERYLAEAIESALRQDYPHKEVLVVDDGSTDGSRTLIEQYVPHVKPIYKANGGQASAFNRGVQEAQGELILFLDADDVLFPEAIRVGVSRWRPGVSCVQWRLQGLNPHGKPMESLFPQDPQISGNLARHVARYGYYPHPPTSGLLFARDALAQILPIDEQKWRISADAPLYTAVPFLGEIEAFSQPLGYYRLHGTNYWNNPKPDLKRMCSQVEHEIGKAEVIREYALRRGVVPAPHLELVNPQILLYRSAIYLLGVIQPWNRNDTLPKLARWGVRSAFYYPYIPYFKSRIRLATIFLSLLYKDKNRALQIVMRRLFSHVPPEEIETFIHQVHQQLSSSTPKTDIG